nr:hypothetical protein 2 [Wenzhou shrimp virus 6]
MPLNWKPSSQCDLLDLKHSWAWQVRQDCYCEQSLIYLDLGQASAAHSVQLSPSADCPELCSECLPRGAWREITQLNNTTSSQNTQQLLNTDTPVASKPTQMSTVLAENSAPIIEQTKIERRAYTSANTYLVDDPNLYETLEREVTLVTGMWTKTTPQITDMTADEVVDPSFKQPRLASLNLMPDILAASKLIRDRLSAIAYFRADVEAELRVQANPFVQGALWMWYSPLEDKVDPWRQHLSEHLRSITSYPGSELNLQHPTRSITLTIPYTSEDQMLPTIGDNHMGRLNLSVLSQLAGADDSIEASFSIICRLKNIKLYGMAPINPTSASVPIRAVSRHEELERPPTGVREGVKYHIESGPFHTEAAEEEAASKKGIISSVSDTVSTVADVLSDVPIIGDIAKPVSWISKAVSGVASIFGFSKPTDMTKNTVFSNIPGRGFTHVEGIDQSVSLSALPDNMVETHTTFSDQDEMSLAHIFERDFVAGHARWSTGDISSTVVGTLPVYPCPLAFSTQVLGNRCYFLPPSGVVASLFQYWRGCPVLNLKFAKTQFHQGRLLVQYTPPTSGAGHHPINQVYTTIIDLSTVDHTGVVIDFTSVIRNKWLELNSTVLENVTAGTITISVLNELIAADTVADFVDIYAWMHWKNFEVAEPGSALRIYSGNNDHPEVTVTHHTVDLQAGDTSATVGPGVIGMLNNYPPSWIHAEDTIEGTPITIKDGTNITHNGNYNTDTEQTITFSEPIGTDNTTLYYFTTSPPSVPVYHTALHLTPGEYQISHPCTITGYTCGFGGSVVIVWHDGLDAFYAVGVEGEEDVGAVFSSIPIDVTSTKPYISVEGGDVILHALAAQNVTASPREYHVEMETLTPNTFIDSSNLTSTMGETVVSLRALTRRFTKTDTFSSTWDGYPMRGVGFFADQQQSLAAIISFLYRFQRGSWRYKFIATEGNLVAISGQRTSTGGPLDQLGAMHIQDVRLNPIVEVSKPFYSPTDLVGLSTNSFDRSGVHLSSVGNSTAAGIVYEATGDDHSFHFLVGAPVVFLNHET